ncbi:transposase [Planobispora longispora]|uniref:transposase n=1 Tax=Planobispora longispora TaxID=28887 RepID=UPI0035A25D79
MVVLDTQSVHVAAGVPAETTGRDVAKKVPGRKRGLAVDVLGLVIAVVVLAASAHENAAGIALLDRLDTREQALTRQIEQTQTGIDSLTARLSELSQEAEHLRISRKTLLSLAEADPAPAEPDAPPLVGFDHPDYQQILTVFSETGGSLRGLPPFYPVSV